MSKARDGTVVCLLVMSIVLCNGNIYIFILLTNMIVTHAGHPFPNWNEIL